MKNHTKIVYNISKKTLIDAKPFHFWFDEIVEFMMKLDIWHF